VGKKGRVVNCGTMLWLGLNPMESGTFFLSSEGILMESDMSKEAFGKMRYFVVYLVEIRCARIKTMMMEDKVQEVPRRTL
jgi:hypothetical protein